MSYSTPDLMKLWSLTDPIEIAETVTSKIYRITHENQLRVLKVYTDIGAKDETNGAKFMKACNGAGFPFVYAENNDAVLMDFIDGHDLASPERENPNGDTTEAIAEVLKTIHAVPIPSSHPFKPLKKQFKELFEYAARDDCPDIVKRTAVLAETELNNQDIPVMLHGDMHHENIRYDSRRGAYVAFDPKGLVGDAAYDCANTFRNPEGVKITPERIQNQADIFHTILGIPKDKILKYAQMHACLSSCWTYNSDGAHSDDTLRVAEMIALLLK